MSERVIKLMTFNILRDGTGELGDRRERIAAVVRHHSPDLLCMQEGGDDLYWTRFAQDLGFRHFENVPGEYKPALFSRLPVSDSASDADLAYVYFRLDLGATSLGVYSVHLPYHPARDELRLANLNSLLDCVRTRGDANVCLAGDFNSRSRGEPGEDWGLEYFARRNDCPIGADDWLAATELMHSAGFVDCYRTRHAEPGYTRHPAVDNLRGMGPAFWERAKQAAGLHETSELAPATVRIDYVYANPALASGLSACELDASNEALAASDHLPLIASFTI